MDTLVTSYISRDTDHHRHIRQNRGSHACIPQSLDQCALNDNIDRVHNLVDTLHGSNYLWTREGEDFVTKLLELFPAPTSLIEGIGKATFTGCVKRYAICLGSRSVHVRFT